MLNREHLVALISDPDFYTRCPAFVWLRDSALAAKKQYEKPTKSGCAACDSNWGIIRPHVDGFVHNLRQLYDLNPKNVACVREYLADIKGYVPNQILIFYRSSKNKLTRFQF